MGTSHCKWNTTGKFLSIPLIMFIHSFIHSFLPSFMHSCSWFIHSFICDGADDEKLDDDDDDDEDKKDDADYCNQ